MYSENWLHSKGQQMSFNIAWVFFFLPFFSFFAELSLINNIIIFTIISLVLIDLELYVLGNVYLPILPIDRLWRNSFFTMSIVLHFLPAKVKLGWSDFGFLMTITYSTVHPYTCYMNMTNSSHRPTQRTRTHVLGEVQLEYTDAQIEQGHSRWNLGSPVKLCRSNKTRRSAYPSLPR